MKKHWLQLRYVLWLGVLLLLMFKIGGYIKFVLHRLFNIPYDSLSVGITGIIIQAAAFTVVIGVGLKDQRKTLASVCLANSFSCKKDFNSS